MRITSFLGLALLCCVTSPCEPEPIETPLPAEDGRALWLRHAPLPPGPRLAVCRALLARAHFPTGADATLAVAREDLLAALHRLLGEAPVPAADDDATLLVGTADSNPAVAALDLPLDDLGRDGFILRALPRDGHPRLVVAAREPLGVLYGVFELLRRVESDDPLDHLDVRSVPVIAHRIVNHWDNLDGSIERGYAGRSLWEWSELPEVVDPRIRDYARACASVGLNVTVLNNVNAQPEILAPDHIAKAAALADTLRPYGLRLALSPPFDAPMRLGGLDTADPTDPAVIAWWRATIEEIYRRIPDFHGFLVKADSERRPGPHAYGLTHDAGANMLARLLAPHGGIVMWRAFSVRAPADFEGRLYPVPPSRDEYVSWGYRTFAPLDGRFDANVAIQLKNGPRDFQPREFPNPLFWALDHSSTFLEGQIVQEYLGQDIHLVFLAPMWRETLDFVVDPATGATVADIVDGGLHQPPLTGMAGVLNTGEAPTWLGHHFAPANWYAFGRLAWDPRLPAEPLATEWARQTFGPDPVVVSTVVAMMMGSWQAYIDYTHPLGLLHLTTSWRNRTAAWGETELRDHFGPALWRHAADATGIGDDRSPAGTDFVAQLPPALRDTYADPATCPDEYLLFFHRVPWDHRLASGRTVWEELLASYDRGVDYVAGMRRQWRSLAGRVDARRHAEVAHRLEQQWHEALHWREVSVAYWREARATPPAPPDTPAPAN